MNRVLFSSQSDEWSTPQGFFEKLDAEFRFTLDPCSTDENAKCEKHYTREQDGLKQSWHGETVFCNPPYGREIGKWVEKCANEARAGATVVMLIPARTDTTWFHKHIYGQTEVRFIRGRLKFGGSRNSAPFPSMVVVFKKEVVGDA